MRRHSGQRIVRGWTSLVLASALLVSLGTSVRAKNNRIDVRYCVTHEHCESGDSCLAGTCRGRADTRVKRLFPIAVDHFVIDGLGENGDETAQNASNQLRYLLDMSGFFRVLSPEQIPLGASVEGVRPTTIDFQSWSNKGAHAIIKGGISAKGADHIELRLYLYMTETWERVDLVRDRQTVATNSSSSMAIAVARWADGLVTNMTGKGGSFSTPIVYSQGPRSFGPREIHVMDVLGKQRRQVTHNGRVNILPSWTIDGRVAYTTIGARTTHLYVEKQTLSTYPMMNIGADFHPDGQRVALSLSKDGDTEIYVLNVKTGSIEQRLTNRRSTDTSPSWSPDGKRLVFVSDRISGMPQIHIMNQDGSGMTKIPQTGGYNTSPDWSPLGEEIAYCSMVDGGRFDIFISNLRTRSVRRLTRSRSNRAPSFSPDGRYVAFSSNRTGSYQLWLMTARGENPRQLTDWAGHFFSPNWATPSAH